MIKLVVFDFDGTLGDSRKLIFLIIKRNLEKKGYKIGREFKKEMGDTPLDHCLAEIGIDNIDDITDKINKEIITNYKKVRLVKEIKVLEKIKKEKIVMSNNNQKYLEKIINKNKLNFFSEIYGGRKSKLKQDILKEVLKKKKIKPSEAVYLGDKGKDAEVARKAGCFSVLISHKESWSPRKEILKAKPDFIINSLTQLKEIIDKLDKVH